MLLQVQKHGRRERGAAGGADVRGLHARPVLLAGLPEGFMEERAQGGVPSGGSPRGEQLNWR